MSSSDPPQLRLSLSQSASTFKRSFDQFGFDLDSPLDSTAVASSSGTDEHRPGPSNGDRNKRARSSSVNPNSTEQPHVVDTPPSSSSSHTLSSASSNQVVVNHRDAPPAPPATRHPQAPGSDPFFPSSLGGELNHTSSELFDARGLDVLPVDPPTTSVWSSQLSSANASIEQNDQFRISMERFHAFDSQISSIRSRPSPLPFRVPANPSTLPPLTLSSPIERSHSHISPPVSLPSVESLSYTSPSAQASAPAPPSTAPPSSISPDQYHPDMSRFEEFGEFREMMGFFQGGHPNSPNIDRPSVRRRHQSPDNSDMPRIPPFRRFTSRHITENVSRNSATHMWSSDHRGTVPDDSDEDLGSRPVVTTMLEDRGPLDLPRPHHDPPQPANRLRRSMETQAPHLSFGRVSPPLFPPAMPPSQGEPNSTSYPVNGPRTQEPGRSNRNEPWSIHHPSRLPVFAEAVRTLTGRLGRPRQRTSYAGESRAERSRSPGASTLSSSMLSPTRYDVPSGYPELRSSEHSPYELDLATPSPWFNEDNHTSRPSIPSSRVHREIPTSRQVPWRSSLPSNETSEDRFLTYLSFLQRPSVTASPGDVTQPGA
ncbi:hypothetical protein F5148DRAFT_551155 [Russula earlei]|uniref:Uncharacterized protein n=1 Tax=Russula earlei TaxID=71964 RepID=A0ACC0TYC9_9AGAM|nr:hypothetical protein F5148DRAFT_551155 [Russula earlei]